jgi:Fur family transcriptional regulator, ferric uptake regulator
MEKPDIATYFTDYLKGQKLRVTPERFEVLDAVLAVNDHFDADQLFLRMKNAGSKVSRATVYNTLDKLTACGIIARYRFDERLAKYELIYESEPHHHMICRVCGRIEEFSDRRVDRLARDAASTMQFELSDAVLHIFGICPACATERNAGQAGSGAAPDGSHV